MTPRTLLIGALDFALGHSGGREATGWGIFRRETTAGALFSPELATGWTRQKSMVRTPQFVSFFSPAKAWQTSLLTSSRRFWCLAACTLVLRAAAPPHHGEFGKWAVGKLARSEKNVFACQLAQTCHIGPCGFDPLVRMRTSPSFCGVRRFGPKLARIPNMPSWPGPTFPGPGPCASKITVCELVVTRRFLLLDKFEPPSCLRGEGCSTR